MLSSDDPPPPPPPPWGAPKAPIPPQRLAKLANALGVPIPAVRIPFVRPQSDAVTPPPRSSTPSTPTSSTSKYLLHVIPPLYLPHRSNDPDLPLPPQSASGYHAQYHRGILVPVYANFQSQLAAIAKEYGLPSTTGLVLYLVTSVNGGTEPPEGQAIEPGPCLSEEIWKHVWTRVVRAEQVDANILPQSPLLYRRGTQSSNSSPHENDNTSLHLRPLLSAGAPKSRSIASAFISSSGVSSTFDLLQSSKSPSLTSTEDSDTPYTSSPSQASLDGAALKANGFVLPGLNSPSLIPVLAKVEFDIDRQRAGWYEPWLLSRRLNRAKQTGRWKGWLAEVGNGEEQDSESHGKNPPLALLTGTKGATVLRNARFSGEFDIEDNSNAEDTTVRVSTAKKPPPLSLVPDIQDKLAVPCEPSTIPNGAGNVCLACLKESSKNGIGSDEGLEGYPRIRSPEESEKRVGAIFDDFDLGLDPSGDFDDYDPNDRRRSQLLMKVKLDEIEKAMLQLSPRALKSTLEEDPIVGSPNKSTHLSPSPKRAGDARPPTLRRASDDSFRESQNISKAWPAVSYAALKESVNPVQTDGPLSPPRLAVNGVSAAAPMHYIPPARSSNLDVSPETEQRKKELEEDYPFNLMVKVDDKITSDSPIPLSPGSFNRYPTTPEPSETLTTARLREIDPIPGLKASSVDGVADDKIRASTTATASRFSMDSMDEVIAKPSNRTTIISMKSIKRLWRRSDKTLQFNNPTSTPSTGRASPNRPPLRPERPSQEELDLPPTPDVFPSYRASPTPGFVAAGRLSVEQLSVPPLVPGLASSAHLEGLHFNQESPYPTRLPPFRYSPKPASAPLPAQVTPVQEKSTRKSILKWGSRSRGGSVSQAIAGTQESRTSTEQSRPPSSTSSVAPNGTRGRQLSLSTGHDPTSSLDIPPSPRIPEHFLNSSRQAIGNQQSDGKLPRSSTDSEAVSEQRSSLRPSMTSSRDSHESSDAYQFEMVSPKTTALTYPYHGLDPE